MGQELIKMVTSDMRPHHSRERIEVLEKRIRLIAIIE